MLKLRSFVFAAALVAAFASPVYAAPSPYPDTWSCGNIINPQPAFCLRLTGISTGSTSTILEVTGSPGRLVYIHSPGATTSPLLSVVESAGDINTISGRFYNQGAGIGSISTSVFQFGALMTSQLGDGAKSATGTTTKSGIFLDGANGAGNAATGLGGAFFTGPIVSGSDPKLKDDLAPTTETPTDVLQRMKAVKLYTYKLKGDTQRVVHFGFNAKELMGQFPAVVVKNRASAPDAVLDVLNADPAANIAALSRAAAAKALVNDALGVDLGSMEAYLAQALKGAAEEIDTLKANNAAQEARLKALEAAVASMQ